MENHNSFITDEELTVREKNWILSAVSCRKTPEEAGLTRDAQLRYYQIIRTEAQDVYDRLGVWPVFELWELD